MQKNGNSIFRNSKIRVVNWSGFVCYSVILTLMFCFIYACEQLENKGNIVWTAGSFVLCVAISALLGVLLGFILQLVLFSTKEFKTVIPETKEKRFTNTFIRLFNHKHLFWFVFAAELLFMVPVYLSYFPGICAYDFSIQIGQVSTGEYNEHHPLLHTCLIGFFSKLGTAVFHDASKGIALMAAIQMIALAAVLAYGLIILARTMRKPWPCLIYTILIIGSPFQWYLGISITKDVPFAIFFFLTVLEMVQICREERTRLRFGFKDAICLISLVATQLFRTNAPYVVIAFAGILLLLFSCTIIHKNNKNDTLNDVSGNRSNRKVLFLRLFLITVLSVLLSIGLSKGLSAATGAVQADRREMLSVPEQQIARVMLYHRDEIPEDRVAFVERIIWKPGLLAYRPEISDPVKKHTITYEIKANAKQFVKMYVDFWIMYPGDMLNAILALDAGYLNPLDETHAWINNPSHKEGLGLGYIQTHFDSPANDSFGVYETPILTTLKPIYDQLASSNILQRIPVVKLLFVPGIYLWGYLLLLATFAFRKKESNAFLILLPLLYLGTILLGPTVQLRYIYGVMLLFLFLACLLIQEDPRNCG